MHKNNLIVITAVVLSVIFALISNLPIIYESDPIVIRLLILAAVAIFSTISYFIGRKKNTELNSSTIQMTISGHSKDHCLQQLIDTFKYHPGYTTQNNPQTNKPRSRSEIFDDLLKQYETSLEEIVQDSIAWSTGKPQEEVEVRETRLRNQALIDSFKNEYYGTQL